MAVPTTSWDETAPSATADAGEGDDRIRELKTQIREVIDVDHDFPSSGQAADVGQHVQITLQEQADLGTGASGVPILGAQTAASMGITTPELVFTDEDDDDVQLTISGYPFIRPENRTSDPSSPPTGYMWFRTDL